MVERLRDHKAQLIDELRRYDALRDLPFPIGYVGLPIVELEAALRFNYTQGISDPVERKLNILIWIMSSMAGNGDTGEHYQGIKDEYHQLRHEDRTTTDECGICEYLD
jgi:hypothetical protein